LDGVVKDLAAFLEWIEHHGVIVSILSLCIGGAGTRAWDKFENRRELTVEKSAISLSSNDDIKVLVLEKTNRFPDHNHSLDSQYREERS